MFIGSKRTTWEKWIKNQLILVYPYQVDMPPRDTRLIHEIMAVLSQ